MAVLSSTTEYFEAAASRNDENTYTRCKLLACSVILVYKDMELKRIGERKSSQETL